MDTQNRIQKTMLTAGAYVITIFPVFFVTLMFSATEHFGNNIMQLSLDYILSSPEYWTMQIAACLIAIIVLDKGIKRLFPAAMMVGTIMAATWQTFMGIGSV